MCVPAVTNGRTGASPTLLLGGSPDHPGRSLVSSRGAGGCSGRGSLTRGGGRCPGPHARGPRAPSGRRGKSGRVSARQKRAPALAGVAAGGGIHSAPGPGSGHAISGPGSGARGERGGRPQRAAPPAHGGPPDDPAPSRGRAEATRRASPRAPPPLGANFAVSLVETKLGLEGGRARGGEAPGCQCAAGAGAVGAGRRAACCRGWRALGSLGASLADQPGLREVR